MPILYAGTTMPISVATGQTLVLKELTGTATATGSTASREDASTSIGAGFVVYGPQPSASTVSLTTTGICEWRVVNGDATPARDAFSVTPFGVASPDSLAVLANSGVGAYLDPSIPGALEDALSAASASLTDTTIFLQPGATYALTRNPIVNVFNTSIVGNSSLIDASAVTRGLTFDFITASADGSDVRKSKSKIFSGFSIKGPGKAVSGSKGLYVDSTGASGAVAAPRPSFSNVFVYDFETLVGGRNQFYLADLRGICGYRGVYGIWQEAGVDAGEMCSWTGGSFDLCDCLIRLDDDSAEHQFTGLSFDYSKQLIVATNGARVAFIACHPENRGNNLAADSGNYILDGSGADTRAPYQALDTTVDGARFVLTPRSTQTGAITVNVGGSGVISVKTEALANPGTGEWVNGEPRELVRSVASNCYIIQAVRTYGNIPCVSGVAGTTTVTCGAIVTRDCFIDVDGDGSIVKFMSGVFDINGSGGAGPYAYRRLIKVRHAGAQVLFEDVYGTNFLNSTNLLWDGPGRVRAGLLMRQGSNPGMPSRLNHQQRNNLFGDSAYAQAIGRGHQVWVSLDTNDTTPTNRYTATNGTLAIATPPIGNATSTTWSIAGEVLTVGGTIGAAFVRDMVISGTGVTAGTKIIGPLPTANTYLIDTSQTVAGSGTLTGTVAKALALTKLVGTTGSVGRFTTSFALPVPPDRRVSANMLVMIPTTSGMNGGSLFITAQFARLSELLDANGLPQIIERFTSYSAVTPSINSATYTKDTWQDQTLGAWGTQADAPPGTTHVVFDVNCGGITTANTALHIAFPHASLWG